MRVHMVPLRGGPGALFRSRRPPLHFGASRLVRRKPGSGGKCPDFVPWDPGLRRGGGVSRTVGKRMVLVRFDDHENQDAEREDPKEPAAAAQEAAPLLTVDSGALGGGAVGEAQRRRRLGRSGGASGDQRQSGEREDFLRDHVSSLRMGTVALRMGTAASNCPRWRFKRG